MYELNGFALESEARSWHLQDSSEPYAGAKRRLSSLALAGLDGVVGGMPADLDPAYVPLVVRAPRADLATLEAIAVAAAVLRDPAAGREAEVELVSTEPVHLPTDEPLVDVKILLRLPSGTWRDVATTTSPSTAIDTNPRVVSVFAASGGLTAPVQDAIVRVRGQITGARVADHGGSWFEYPPSLPAGSYLRFHAGSGQAFVTATDTWTGGTDVSGLVDFGGPRGCFEITPHFPDPADPFTRDGRLSITSSARADAAIEVRGRAAYAI